MRPTRCQLRYSRLALGGLRGRAEKDLNQGPDDQQSGVLPLKYAPLAYSLKLKATLALRITRKAEGLKARNECGWEGKVICEARVSARVGRAGARTWLQSTRHGGTHADACERLRGCAMPLPGKGWGFPVLPGVSCCQPAPQHLVGCAVVRLGRGGNKQPAIPTARGFEPLRAEPNGFLVHLLNHSDTLSYHQK